MRLGLLSVLCLALTACATSYHPVDTQGGYAEKRLSDELYQVSFRANSYTPEDRIAAYLLYRAAEIAKREGAVGFIVHRERVAASISKPRLRPTDERVAVITIQILSEMATGTPPQEVYQADEILMRLRRDLPDLP
ncbi:MAG TPA: hypothetical protein VFA38_08865 [Nitrospirales bacterium]|nr:hypothetical protein [Nitrospirales bacterium]